MPAWTTISNALVAVGAKPFATTIQALRDNVLAAMEGDATATAAGVTLKDPALDTGAATAAGIAWVGLRTAGLATGAVGSYALLRFLNETLAGSAQAPGATVAGSNLLYSPGNGGSAATAPSGTWRLMGRTINTTGGGAVSLFLRIS